MNQLNSMFTKAFNFIRLRSILRISIVLSLALLGSYLMQLSAQSLENSIELVPLQFNEKKLKLAGEERNSLKKSVLNRSGGETVIITIDILSGGSLEYCLEFPVQGEIFESIQDLECSGLNYISYEIDSSCITFNAVNTGGQIFNDTLCIQLTGSSGSIVDFLLILRVRPARNLPFVDDFSYPGPWPHSDYWTDRKVFVNSTFGAKPRSVGVATFDGLNAEGTPYGGGFGESDHLTSTFINMNSAIADRCFLTFFIQAGGNGYYPSEGLLKVEFKNQDGEWVEKASFSVNEYPAYDSFYFQSIQLPAEYFFNGFQFRFINLSDRTGISSVWNLDYVKLANEFQANLIFENDIAFTRTPTSLLNRYSAMPLKQFRNFEEFELADDVEIGIFNHFEQRRQADPSNLRFIEMESGQQLLSETLLEVPPVVAENQRDLDPGRHFFVNDVQNFNSLLNAVKNAAANADKQMVVRTQYSFQQNEEQIPEFQRNNQVQRDTRFEHYFAYDDNSAEKGLHILRAQGPAPSLAVQFHANQGDTLRGVALHLPRVLPGDRNKQYRLMVWGASLNDPPLYESETINPVFVDTYYDSIQGFTTHALKSPLTDQDTSIFIPAGDFYVGWKQISRGDNGLYVGFDLNSPDKAQYIYWNNGASWRPIQEVVPSIKGAVMIRPVFGNEQLISTPVRETTDLTEPLMLFPNPTTEFIHSSLEQNTDEPTTVEVYSLSGQLVLRTVATGRLDVSGLSPGKYLLIWYGKDGKKQSGKFIKQ